MMTYLKHVGNYKHAELKIKKLEEVQALYEKIKRSDKDFISIGSAEDEREDLNAVYQLVMEKYQDEIPEGFDKVLWGDLMIMFNPDDENEFWNAQQRLEDCELEVCMVLERLKKKKELEKESLLESEEDSTMALELIRFVKKQIAELEPEDSDGDEKDL
ncbi:hypothetical protein Tco_0906537 [Tanacetum coccineum]|uniref:Uncharacterized protein n=1 Tax=Tanacetum coccineum TaxID=301880 RepID=A0ABQ5CIS9_9ASTR